MNIRYTKSRNGTFQVEVTKSQPKSIRPPPHRRARPSLLRPQNHQRLSSVLQHRRHSRHNANNANVVAAAVQTVASSLVSTGHGRARRRERRIPKLDLQRARRYGMKEECDPRRYPANRCKYTWGGITFIYDHVANREITSYAAGKAGLNSGTRFVKPLLLPLKEYYNSQRAEQEHVQLKQQLLLLQKIDCTTTTSVPVLKIASHSVFCVDLSGSMRTDDVNGARCRSDAVFLTIARDFVRTTLLNEQQEEEQQQNDNDNTTSSKFLHVMSVIVMRQDGAQVIFEHEPVDWVLYNRLLALREWTALKPMGHGHYLPALDLAQQLLLELETTTAVQQDRNSMNNNDDFPLSLVFLSDGKPSDRGDFGGRMAQIASRWKERLTVRCVAFVGETYSSRDDATTSLQQHLRVLQDMVQEAQAQGVRSASLERAQLVINNNDCSNNNNNIFSGNSLAQTLSSLSSAILSSSRTQQQQVRIVRMDLEREPPQSNMSNSNQYDVVNGMLTQPNDWNIYDSSTSDKNNNAVVRIWTWDRQRDDFCYVLDPRCLSCKKPVYNALSCFTSPGAMQCPVCQACFFCQDCRVTTVLATAHAGSKYCQVLQQDVASGKLVLQQQPLLSSSSPPVVPSFAVAMKKTVFGEGVERLVRKFRFLDSTNRTVLEPGWVAKASRFVEEEEAQADMNKASATTPESLMAYHRNFMRTQVLAADFAQQFNQALDGLLIAQQQQEQHCSASSRISNVLQKLPRIRFLQPLVVELQENGQQVNVLVEQMLLGGSYKKFNNNMGYVRNVTPRGQRQQQQRDPPFSFATAGGGGGLDAIQEDEEDGQPDGREESGISDCRQNSTSVDVTMIDAKDIPQAFSHFTYEKSNMQLMVVDLQGILQHNRHNGTCEYVLTDPAIHRRRSNNNNNNDDDNADLGLVGHLGRTDRGDEGIQAFWRTHVCTAACRLFGLAPRL